MQFLCFAKTLRQSVCVCMYMYVCEEQKYFLVFFVSYSPFFLKVLCLQGVTIVQQQRGE
jgi:hypothetical protein